MRFVARGPHLPGHGEADRASLRTMRASRLPQACVLVLGCTILAACGGGGGDGAGSTQPLATPTELTGLIVDTHGPGREVTSFTLESDGEKYDIRIAPEVDYGFDLNHLREHQKGRWPVRCTLERRNGALYALSIGD